MEREEQIRQFHHVLNTTEGELMMAELKLLWCDGNPLDVNAQTMGFNVGLQQAYRQLEQWRDYE